MQLLMEDEEGKDSADSYYIKVKCHGRRKGFCAPDKELEEEASNRDA